MKNSEATALYVIAMVAFVIVSTVGSFYVIYLAETGKSAGLAAFSANLHQRIEDFGTLAPLAFMSLYVVASLLLLPVLLLTMAGGVLFPPYEAMLYSIIGVFLATFLPFMLARGLLHKHVERFVHRRYRKYDDILNHLGFGNVVLLRLLPIVPFEMFNYLAGLGRIRTWKYVVGSLLGIIPGTIINVMFFSSVHETLKKSGLTISALANFKVGLFLAFNLVVYAATIGYIYYRYKKHRSGRKINKL
jgi:uncharacterized membrane protein YdjX (TVP38/TMEM64 family)